MKNISLIFWIAASMGKPMTHTKAKLIADRFSYDELNKIYRAVRRKSCVNGFGGFYA